MRWKERGNCWDDEAASKLLLTSDRPSGVTVEFVENLCGPCPVRLDCLEYAIRARVEYGFWGGIHASAIRRNRSRPEALAAVSNRVAAKAKKRTALAATLDAITHH